MEEKERAEGQKQRDQSTHALLGKRCFSKDLSKVFRSLPAAESQPSPFDLQFTHEMVGNPLA